MEIMARQEQTVEQLFCAALERRPEDRSSFLDRVCAGAPEVRQRVEELLLADEQAGSFLNRQLLIRTADPSDAPVPNPEIRNDRADPRVFGFTGRFEPGQTIASRFTVIRFIARGGMGEVYEVEDGFLQGMHVALKVILPHVAEDAGSTHRFEQEVLLARRIIHPNLCPIYDISRCEDPAPPFFFLTMKLLSGETLAARLARPPAIPRGETLSIFRQMIAGVAAIHDAGVIHRDIKPNNVMLDDSGSELCLSIMDFGLARLYDSQATVLAPGFVAGTPGYIAPELLRGDPPSQATDIFALGVLFQQTLISGHTQVDRSVLSAKPSPALDSADVPPIFIHFVKEFLSKDPARRCLAFKQIRSTVESPGSIAGWSSSKLSNSGARHILTRRNFVIGSALTTCAAIGGIAWKHERIYDLFHPLPPKRFVAILDWPPPDPRVKPMLMGLIDAMANELARAEVFDHNLFITAPSAVTDMRTTAELNDVRESLGANLVLATSTVPSLREYHVFLQVLDTISTLPLRSKLIGVPVSRQASLPGIVVRAAAALLDINSYQPQDKRFQFGTANRDALDAFQHAEALMKQPNFTGIESAIAQYKQAVESDPHFALAYARLALAYLRFYAMHRDSSSMDLAKANAETSLSLDPDLVEGHVALASVFQGTGDESRALHEMASALALDPSNPKTLIYQGQIYARLNRWDDAEKVFLRVLKERPNDWLAYNELGMNYNSQGNYPKALHAFRAASMAAPKNTWALSNVASLCFQLGKFDEAIDAANKSMAIEPNDTAASTMAEVLRAQKKYTEALQWALLAVKLNPDDSTNLLELGDCYSRIRSHSVDAETAYKNAARVQEQQMQTDPTNGPGWMLVALYRIKSGLPDSAYALMKKAESLNASDLYSQLFKVRILELLGHREEALAMLNTCMKRGATSYQMDASVDLDSLRSDPRYSDIMNSHRSINVI
jgi:serine/threonine protein kinase/tetratricopeptide (TPR) repeat protein